MGILNKIFKSKKINVSRVELMNGYNAVFSPFSGNAYENDIYRAAVDAIARNAAKLKVVHIISLNGQRREGSNKLNRLLQVRPNPYMNAYDLIYKLVTHFYLYNNAFAYIRRDDAGNITAIYPLSPTHMEYMQDATGEIYCKFYFNSKEYLLPYSDIIALKRFYNANDLLGDSNTAILPTLEVAHMQSEGLQNSIRSGATIRGLLKYNQILSPEKLKEEKDAFIDDYLTMSNNGGVAVIDEKATYTPLEHKPISIDDKQLNLVKEKIYNYLGVSESIVNSTYTEDEWAAFYESTIEPLGLQIGLELTSKLFNQREQAFGNSIILEANRLQFASTKTKNDLIFNLLPMGVISINEAREILNLSSIEDGDKYIQSLNYINKDLADTYQGGDKSGDKK